VRLAVTINETLKERSLRQGAAAKLLRLNQPEILSPRWRIAGKS